MKRTVSIFATIAGLHAAALSSAAMAADFTVACAKPGDERTIEIVSPGQVGQACDVRYVRESGQNISIPYHANNSAEFCTQKANEIVDNLKTAGYACAPVAAVIVAEAPAPAVEAAPVQLEQPAPTEPVIAAAPVMSAPENEAALEEEMNRILSEPVAANQEQADQDKVAVRGPAQLTTQTATPVTNANATPSVGRLVGAEPVEPASVDPIAVEEKTQAPAPVRQAAATTPTPSAQPAQKSDAKSVRRTPEQVILATLNAQAAAWNEGNLDAFMETYWNSDDLKFVSNTAVTKGWSSTMKRYRENYASDGGLGRLVLDKTDVTLVTDDVAIVTGRFKHLMSGESSAGGFSLVWKRINGVWRIVHDHSVTEAAATQ